MEMESINNQAPQKQEIPELIDLKQENQVVFETRDKIKGIIESMLDNKSNLEQISQKFIICMNSGNTEEAIKLARDMAMQAELKDDLKKLFYYSTGSDQLPLDSEHNRALVDTRITTAIPTVESVNELMHRYTEIQDNLINNRYLRKLLELKDIVASFWEAHEKVSKKNQIYH